MDNLCNHHLFSIPSKLKWLKNKNIYNDSGALAALCTVTNRTRTTYKRRNRKLCNFFFTVNMAGNMAGKHVPSKTMMNDDNVAQPWWPSLAALIGLPHISLMLDIHVMVNWHLSKQGIY